MIPKLFAFALVAALAGCASSPATRTSSTNDAQAAAPATRPGNSLDECSSAAVASLAGQPYSERLRDSARNQAGASSVRVLKPGQVMTLEYNPMRLTIVVDEAGNVHSARCG